MGLKLHNFNEFNLLEIKFNNIALRDLYSTT